jgi:hypothetical protein
MNRGSLALLSILYPTRCGSLPVSINQNNISASLGEFRAQIDGCC